MPFHPPRVSGRPGHQWPLPRLGTPIKDPTLQARRTESLVLMPSPSWKGRKGTPPLQLQAGRVQRAPLRAASTHSAPIPEHHHTSTKGSPQQSHRSLRGRAPRKARRTTCPVTEHAQGNSKVNAQRPWSVHSSASWPETVRRQSPAWSLASFQHKARCTQPLEPILFPKLRIYFADFPYLHCSIN